MAATYTFDVFSSLDGYGAASGNWTGYWGKQGPELLDHRLALYSEEQRMVFGANTYRAFTQMLASSTEESEVRDPWVTRMRNLPATVVSTTLQGSLDWPDATVVRGDAVDVVARLKDESEVPLRSHGSLSMNRALMAAGLVDRVQVTLFPVITGQTGLDPIFQGAADFDLEPWPMFGVGLEVGDDQGVVASSRTCGRVRSALVVHDHAAVAWACAVTGRGR